MEQRISGSCDLFVDSFVYGAHTTAADALWAGLPLLTLRGFGVGKNSSSRLTAASIRASRACVVS